MKWVAGLEPHYGMVKIKLLAGEIVLHSDEQAALAVNGKPAKKPATIPVQVYRWLGQNEGWIILIEAF